MTSAMMNDVERLFEALQALSRALAAGGIDAVLDAERPMVDAIARLPLNASGTPALTDEERDSLRTIIGSARVALADCRRMGETAGAMAAAGAAISHTSGRAGGLSASTASTTVQSRG
jgi:hypothetical protein